MQYLVLFIFMFCQIIISILSALKPVRDTRSLEEGGQTLVLAGLMARQSVFSFILFLALPQNNHQCEKHYVH